MPLFCPVCDHFFTIESSIPEKLHGMQYVHFARVWKSHQGKKSWKGFPPAGTWNVPHPWAYNGLDCRSEKEEAECTDRVPTARESATTAARGRLGFSPDVRGHTLADGMRALLAVDLYSGNPADQRGLPFVAFQLMLCRKKRGNSPAVAKGIAAFKGRKNALTARVQPYCCAGSGCTPTCAWERR